MKKLLREPLLHFLLIGILLFLFWSIWGRASDVGSDRIIVDTSQVNRIKDAWSAQWKRSPTPSELENLIQEYIQEEILYREAVAMGLDNEDTIVRRRLAQKMRFLIQDVADRQQPDEKALRDFFSDNQVLFRQPARVSFTHIFFSQDRRAGKALIDARSTLEKLRTSKKQRAPALGDPFMLNYDYAQVTQQEAAKLFGQYFAEQLFDLQPGKWQGPIRSGYGIHLVRLVDVIPARTPDFTEVVKQVSEQYAAYQRQKMNDAAMKQLRNRYEIIIDYNMGTDRDASS
jgi:peptidyl-prolyl cis-trans isomerase C